MMKFVVVLALVLVAVSAGNKFKQPKMPCDYKIDAKIYEDKKKTADYVVEFNGRYFKLAAKDDREKYVMLLRPDIGSDGNMTAFFSEDDECEVEEVTMDEFKYIANIYSNLFWLYYDDKDWDHKEDKKYRDKKCVHYYDDDKDEPSIYVYDDYIYGVVSGEEDFEYVLEYTWKAPMDDFVMSKKDYPKCYDKEKKVADTPSEDYVMCAASSVKIAFVAMLVALVAALF